MTIILGFMLFVLQAAQPQEPVALAQQAENAYLGGDYIAAKDLYQAIVDQGIEASAIYLNLGSTYFQLEDMGRALVNYRRAQMIAPRDPLLHSHLARLRSTRDDVQGDETFIVDSLAALTTSSLNAQELQTLILSLWCLFFIVLITMIYRTQWRDFLRGPLIVLVVVVLFGLVLWWSRSYTAQYRPPAVVVAARVNVMSGPGDGYLPLYELHAAAELRVLERRDEWVRFVLPDQQQGWLHQSGIEIV